MTRPIAAHKIAHACNQGIQKAHENYVAMSGGDWLWSAPEYFLTTFIALEIHNQPGTKQVIVEHGTKKALKDAGALGKGRLHSDIRQNGRLDILIRRADGSPRGIVEVKNRLYNKTQYKSDLERISKILQRRADASTIEFGIFSFYTVTKKTARGTAQENSETRREKIKRNMAGILGDGLTIDMQHLSFDVGEEWAAHAMSALIKLA